MRVVLINQVFYPDMAATAQHADDLARHLVRHGHEVHVIASRSIYGQRGATLPRRETVAGVEVHRVGLSLFGKGSIPARLLDFGMFYAAAGLKASRVPRPDVLVCFTTPPFIALVGWFVRLVRGSKYVYWLMDLYPDIAVECGVMKPGSLTTRLFDRLNRFCLRKADRVVVLGRCMKEKVEAKGISGEKLLHIGVWSDAAEVSPVPRSENPYSKRWALGERLTVMYSGNFGLAHDIRTMLDAALRFEHDDGVRFLFVGGGKRKAEVEAFIAEHGLTNCVVEDYQPRENLHESLSSGDVHLATMINGAEGSIVPCKLFGIMAAGRPTVFIGHPSSELARVLSEHDAGVVVAPGDVDGLVQAIGELRSDPGRREQMGANARRALGEAFSREAACERWRRMLEEVVGVEHEHTGDDASDPGLEVETGFGS